MQIKQFVIDNWIAILLLLFIITFSVQIRIYNTNSETLSAIDPFFYYYNTRNLIDNNWIPPTWNSLSHYPPGVPTTGTWWGFCYALAGWHYLYKIFDPGATLMFTTHYATGFLAIFLVIIAFMVGRQITKNNYGGLLVPVFLSTPMIISRTGNGFSDSDIITIILSLLCIWTIIRVYKKPNTPNYILAVLSCLVFALSWGVSWWIFYIFGLSVVLLVVVKTVLGKLSKKEFLGLIKPLLIIGIVTSILTLPLNGNHAIKSLQTMSGYATEHLIVMQSIAELQTVAFNSSGFQQIFNNVGYSMYISLLFFIPVIFMLWKRMEFGIDKLFLLVFFLFTFFLCFKGIRYALMFSIANALMASWVLIKIFDIIKPKLSENKQIFFKSIYVGIVIYLCFLTMNIADGVAQGNKNAGMPANWKSALDYLADLTHPEENRIMLYEYWDYGHYYSAWNFFNTFDGAQAGEGAYPYNHDHRIKSSGRIYATSNETEALELLAQYNGLDEEKCEDAKKYHKQNFGVDMPEENCKPIDEVYFMSSADLISKFPWLSFYGGYDDGAFRYTPKDVYDFASHPGLCQTRDTFVYCPWVMNRNSEGEFTRMQGYSFTIVERNETAVPVYITPVGAYIVDNTIVNNQQLDFSSYNPSAEHLDGMLILIENTAIYVPEALKDSIFVKTFFFAGQGLEHFELVYSNSEMSIYRVNFD